MMRKAQVSLEFMTIVGVALAIFFGFFLMSNYQRASTHDLSQELEAKGVCNEFAASVNVALSGGSGFSTYVTMPENIGGEGYNLSIVNSTATLEYDSKVVFCRLLTNNLEYTNPIAKGNLTLRNEDGTIFVE